MLDIISLCMIRYEWRPQKGWLVMWYTWLPHMLVRCVWLGMNEDHKKTGLWCNTRSYHTCWACSWHHILNTMATPKAPLSQLSISQKNNNNKKHNTNNKKMLDHKSAGKLLWVYLLFHSYQLSVYLLFNSYQLWVYLLFHSYHLWVYLFFLSYQYSP